MAKLLHDGREDLAKGDARRYVPLGALARNQTQQLADTVFGSGPGSALLKLADRVYGSGDGTLIKRELALAAQAGALRFGRENADANRGYHIGAFQIGGRDTTRDAALAKYSKNLAAGLALYAQLSGAKVAARYLSLADRDVIAHIGYIVRERGGEATLRRLADPTLRDPEVAHLMSTTIQGGIPATGLEVVRMQQHLIVDTHALGKPQSQSVVGLHSTGADVQEIQRAVGAKVDGRYGPATQKAVRDFQTRHQLKAKDGIAGPETRDAILRQPRGGAQATPPGTATPTAVPNEPVVGRPGAVSYTYFTRGIMGLPGLGGTLTVGTNPDGTGFLDGQLGIGYGSSGWTHDSQGKRPGYDECNKGGTHLYSGLYVSGSVREGPLSINSGGGKFVDWQCRDDGARVVDKVSPVSVKERNKWAGQSASLSTGIQVGISGQTPFTIGPPNPVLETVVDVGVTGAAVRAGVAVASRTVGAANVPAVGAFVVGTSESQTAVKAAHKGDAISAGLHGAAAACYGAASGAATAAVVSVEAPPVAATAGTVALGAVVAGTALSTAATVYDNRAAIAASVKPAVDTVLGWQEAAVDYLSGEMFKGAQKFGFIPPTPSNAVPYVSKLKDVHAQLRKMADRPTGDSTSPPTLDKEARFPLKQPVVNQIGMVR